jgi:hypothetical protein
MLHPRVVQGGSRQQGHRLVEDRDDTRLDRDLGIELAKATAEATSALGIDGRNRHEFAL